MMKIRKKLRSNGGYALVYAVVAMTLMLAVVAGLTLTSVRGLRTQQAAVESLQKRYTAAGEMEKIFAKIATATDLKSISINATSKDTAVESFIQKVKDVDNVIISSVVKDSNKEDSLIVEVVTSGVSATLSLTYNVTENTSPNETYTFSVTSVSYESYSYTEATT